MKIRRMLRTALAGALFASTLTLGTAFAGDFDLYGGDGTVNGQAVTGCAGFEQGGSGFFVEFDPSANSPLGSFFAASGSYEEVNLFFVSFWTASFSDTNDSASGIRLFFGLLAFGTVIDQGKGGTRVLSFTTVVGNCEMDGDPLRGVEGDWSSTRLDADKRRRLVLVR